MESNNKKILFISHEATLSGAPKVLLFFMRWLSEHHSAIEKYTLILQCGYLTKEFSNVSKKVWQKENYFNNRSIAFLIYKKILEKIGIKPAAKEKQMYDEIKNVNPNVIYANTVASLSVAVNIKKQVPNAKLILHVHELPIITSLVCPEFLEHVPHIDLFIAVSKLVRNELITRYRLDPDKVKLNYEFIEPISKFTKEKQSRFLVGASGYLDWRKGYDVFLQVASRFQRQYPQSQIEFKWVGKLSRELKIILREELHKMNLTNVVSFIGETPDPFSEFKKFDLFLMTSREDPFPLVCLEVAQMGIPIICFEKATGICELLENGGGKIIPYLDIQDMTDALHQYFVHADSLIKDSILIEKNSKNYLVDIQAPILYSYINSLLKA